ncbi:MAG: hypothetical protein CMI12_13425 [Oceanospirillum sp.]|nr:hypothetical protein [Oceanospirillum sp.]
MKIVNCSLLQQCLLWSGVLWLTLLAGFAQCSDNGNIPSSKQQESAKQAGKPLYFVLLTNNEQSEFWRLTEQAAKKAANDLGIELQVIPLNGNPLRPVRIISSLVNAPKKPNAVLFSNMKNTGKAVLEILENHRIHSFIFDNGFAASDQIGLPGREYRFWQAELLSDNEVSSRKLTQDLIEAGLSRFTASDPLPMIAMEGNPSSEVNAERLLGMYDTLKKYKSAVTVKQVFRTRWSTKHARNAVLATFQRYPDVKLIWAASDDMAISAAKTLLEIGKKPGEDVFIAGFDRLPKVLDYIDKGQIVNSYGGHYMAAAWGVIYMYDFFNGFNLAHRSMQLPMFSHKSTGIPFETKIRLGNFEEVDFTQFSKTLAPSVQSYPFLTQQSH